MGESGTPGIRELEERVEALERRLAAAPADAAGEGGVSVEGDPDGPLPNGRSRLRRTGVVLGVVLALAMAPTLVMAGVLFNDVPNTSPYFNDIAAIATYGVTTGCGDGNYCPDDFVTREQMAAFLNRLGALSAGKTPVTNAARLDGYEASDLVRLAGTSTSIASPVLTNAEVTFLSVTLTAPTHGYVLVNVAMTGREQACTVNCTMSARLRHVQTGSHSAPVTAWIHERTNIAITYRFPVGPGDQVFETRIHRPTVGDGNMNGWYNHMTALFVPFNGGGLPPN
jgi:hypothetical protein